MEAQEIIFNNKLYVAADNELYEWVDGRWELIKEYECPLIYDDWHTGFDFPSDVD